MDNSKVKVGFVGLGHAGWPMAGNVVRAGFDVVVSDVDPERERAFAEEHGCAAAGGYAGLAGSNVLITMLPNGHVVRDVLLGDTDVASGLAPGAVVVDTSSSDPAGTRVLGADLAKRGLYLIDAPVTMPEPGGARVAKITIMVGADDADALERAEPVLSVMCSHLFRMGALGSGHAMKTLNNFVSASAFIADLDALIVGHRYGLDPSTMMQVLNVGTGRNFSTAHALPEEGLPRTFGTGFSLALLVKDLGIASELHAAMDWDSELVSLVRSKLADAFEALGGDPDHTEALRYWEQRADLELPVAPATESSFV